MHISMEGLTILHRLEGTRSFPYKDVAGLWTTGTGHLMTKSELSSGKIIIAGVPVRYAQGLTHAQIGALLRQDLMPAEAAVNAVKVPLTSPQFACLTSFVFNVGVGAFQGSTLLKRLNAGRYDEIPDQLMRWCYAGGKVVNGLRRRREQEVMMWCTED